MDIYQKKGKLYKLFPAKQITDKFRKQEFILQEMESSGNNTYSNLVKFQCINDKVSLLSDAGKNDFCVIKFSIKGRKVISKTTEEEMFFTNLDVEVLVIVNKANKGPAQIGSNQNVDWSDMVPGVESNAPSNDFIGDSTQNEYEDLPF